MDNKRKKELQINLKRVLKDLTTKYKPERIILFGSFASGKIHSFSDIDLLIVKKTKKKYFDRIREIVGLCEYDIGIDFLVYTPQELKHELKQNSFLKDEILLKGKVLYHAAA
ncbi:MAG: nucleotidyltransferase domain-containing protein [Elusimicrobiota bacterium]